MAKRGEYFSSEFKFKALLEILRKKGFIYLTAVIDCYLFA